ncbi:MAG: calcium-binding protein, partial [Chitinophagaceae bacterium]|nr:calcium-binding protein [Rubrivivax sp.]
GGSTIAGQAVTLTGTTLRDAFGGAGNDLLIGGESANMLGGGWGEDQLLGGAGNDTLQGGFDNDVLDGGTGADSLVGGQGDDAYVVDNAGDVASEAVGQGTDTAFVTGNGWTVSANIEIVRLYGTAATLTGSAGGDVIVASAGATATINAGDGDDTLWGNVLGHFLGGGAGDDIIRGQDGASTMAGGLGNDQFVVGHLNAQVQEGANEGIDTVYLAVNGWTNFANVEIVRLSAPGVVLLNGSEGNEDLVANQGEASTLNGNSGDDTLWGSSFADTLNGGAGNDILRGQGGTDRFIGGTGNDQFVVFSAQATITENAGEGYDIVYFDGVGTLSFGNDIEEARLSGAATGLVGGTGAELLVGNNAGLASSIDGGGGHDTIFGTAATDTITGGAGDDTLYSQGGADIFRFGSQWGYDKVGGFTAGAAKLQFLAESGVTGFGQLGLTSGGGNTQVEFGGYAVLVFGVASLAASDFLFG